MKTLMFEAVAKPSLHVDAFVSNASAKDGFLHVDAFVSNAPAKDGFLHVDAIETIASTGFATAAFACAVGMFFSALTLTAEAVSDVVVALPTAAAADTVCSSSASDALLASDEGGGDKSDQKPSEKPGGDSGTGGNTPPDKPGEGGGSEDSVILTGAHQYVGGTNALADAMLTSTTSDQNVILAMTNAYVTVSNCTLTKTGNYSSEDNSNFYAVNAVVAAKTASMICIANSTLASNAQGANSLFASGSGSTIYAYDCTISSTNDSSRGLDATYGGKVIGSKLDIRTEGDHCAALATDRGNGSISVSGASLQTAGQGSPLVYSTGVIEVNAVTGTATGAQIAGIEGLSTIRIKNSNLTGSGEQASEPVANGVIIYQSNSGDSSDGTATFEVSDSTLASEITTDGALFYITHSDAIITVKNTKLDFDSSVNWLIKAAGNDGEHGWGTEGSNGAGVVFTAIDQTLKGNISVDGISSNDLYLVNSTYTGTFVKDTTYTGDGGVNVFIDSNSTWTVTSNCTLKCLTAAAGAKILDGNGKDVSIINASGTKLDSGSGASDIEITVSNYIQDDFVSTNITDFTISRTAFDAMYGSSGTGSKTYYFKPHAPTNGVVGVSYEGTKIYPDMDHKYWLDDYWTNGVTVTVDFSSDTTSGYFFADGSSVTSLVLTITENRIDVYPPAGFETAYRAQARSGSTYYRTLREAIDAATGRARIILNDNVTLDETLTVTNSITLDLNGTNVLTLGSALTNAFHFTDRATVSNGTINSSLAANVEGSVLMRFTDCKSATLKDLVIKGCGYETVVAHDTTKDLSKRYAKDASNNANTVTCDGLVLTGNGCLLSVDYANATLTNGCSFTADNTLASFGGTHEAAVSCTGNGTVTIADGTYAAPKALQSGDLGGAISVNGGSFNGLIYSLMSANAHTDLDTYDNYKARFTFTGGAYAGATIAFAHADSFDLSAFTKGEEVSLAAPSGYAWQNNSLVREAITAGETSEAYSDAQAATNAAAAINDNKAGSIAIPTGVEDSLKETYLSKVMAMVTEDNCVVVDLTAAAEVEVQREVDEAVTNATALAALVSTNESAKVTIATTTPGLYYWINGGTDVGAVTNAGTSVLSTNGGAVELSKPKLDAAKNRAFFKVAAGVGGL